MEVSTFVSMGRPARSELPNAVAKLLSLTLSIDHPAARLSAASLPRASLPQGRHVRSVTRPTLPASNHPDSRGRVHD